MVWLLPWLVKHGSSNDLRYMYHYFRVASKHCHPWGVCTSRTIHGSSFWVYSASNCSLLDDGYTFVVLYSSTNVPAGMCSLATTPRPFPAISLISISKVLLLPNRPSKTFSCGVLAKIKLLEQWNLVSGCTHHVMSSRWVLDRFCGLCVLHFTYGQKSSDLGFFGSLLVSSSWI